VNPKSSEVSRCVKAMVELFERENYDLVTVGIACSMVIEQLSEAGVQIRKADAKVSKTDKDQR
jgi:hypothetical protein